MLLFSKTVVCEMYSEREKKLGRGRKKSKELLPVRLVKSVPKLQSSGKAKGKNGVLPTRRRRRRGCWGSRGKAFVFLVL